MPYQQHEPWDYFPSRLSQQMIMDPMSVIREFFEKEINIVQARKEMKKWWSSAFSERCLLDKMDIVSLISFRDQLLTVVEAASVLPVNIEELVTMEEAELFNSNNFCQHLQENHTLWDYFPRHLDRIEYENPQFMVSKFFTWKNLPEWRDIVEELFSAAISECSIHACTNDEDILKVCEYIGKLLEALYLLKIRNPTQVQTN